MPDISKRWNVLAASLRTADIHFEFRTREALHETALGRAFCGLIRAATAAGTRDDVLEFAASPFSGAGREALEAADRGWREQRTVDSRRLLAVLGQHAPATKPLVALARAACSTSLSQQSLPVWRELMDSMLGMALELLGCEGCEGDAAAHQALSATVSEMCQVPGASFRPAEVMDAMARTSLRLSSDEREDAVQVLQMQDIGARRFDAVIVGGMSEKEMPLVPRDSAVDELMRAQGVAGAASSTDLERLRFYSLVTRARERIAFARQETDGEGNGLPPSPLWEEVLDVYRSSAGVEAKTGTEVLLDSPPCVSMTSSQIESLSPAYTAGRREQREAAMGLRFEVVDRSEVRTEAARSAIGCDRVFSATEIEAYLECPYRWFYERIVRPEEIDTQIDARMLGDLAHRLLGEFYRRLATDTAWRRVLPQNLDEALEKFDDLAREWAARERSVSVFDDLGVARAIAMARRVIRQDALLLPEFAPVHTEFTFGEDSPFVFAGVRFRGRIDRVDMGGDSLFVMDYKSSQGISGVAKFEDKAKVQVVIYAVAAGEALGRTVAGSVYRSMKSGRLRGFWRTDLLGAAPLGACDDDAIGERAFSELVERTEARVAGAIDAIRAGVIPRSPSVKGTCAHCSVSSVCEGAQR